LPEITLPAPAADPPIVLPVALVSIRTPSRVLPRSSAPVESVPM
jgi:hypothetical protein